MTDRLTEGIKFFNAGHYFEAHEAWEDVWRLEEGPLRLFYQGLIHAAVGLHHRSRGNRVGMTAQLKKCLARLDPYPRTVAGINLEQLRQDIRKLLDESAVRASRPIRIVRMKKNPVVVNSQGTF
jgi:predicted metal-dependent hydrolase